MTPSMGTGHNNILEVGREASTKASAGAARTRFPMLPPAVRFSSTSPARSRVTAWRLTLSASIEHAIGSRFNDTIRGVTGSTCSTVGRTARTKSSAGSARTSYPTASSARVVLSTSPGHVTFGWHQYVTRFTNESAIGSQLLKHHWHRRALGLSLAAPATTRSPADSLMPSSRRARQRPARRWRRENGIFVFENASFLTSPRGAS